MENSSRNSIDRDSIKITKNTKGYNWEVKVYADEGENFESKLIRVKGLAVRHAQD